MSVKLPFKANNKTLRKAVALYQDREQKQKVIQTYGQMHTWNTSRVTDMSYLFSNEFNTGTTFDNINDIISGWDVSKVTNMTEMFSFCKTFNQPLNSWVINTSTVENVNMSVMFRYCETFNQPLNNWNVSRVTNMGGMFTNCKTFNQPLNNWIVSQVENMKSMFSGCLRFNQPLNDWNVSRVTNMGSMFTNCKTFNQPLNTWNTSNVTDMSNMFSGCTNFNQNISIWVINPINTHSNIFNECPITEANKPHIPVTIARVEVNAAQIHQASSKINYEKLNEFLSTKIQQPIVIPQDYSAYIKDTINLIINTISETRETKENFKVGLQKIYDERLKGLKYSEKSPLLRDSIINSLEYVKKQPNDFKQMYVEAFVKDCVHAYEGTDGMTCAAGALERIIFSLVPACKTDPAIPDYITLIIIISGPELIKQSIKDWYILHNSTNSDNDIFHAKTKIEKQADLREYLLQRYPGLPDLIDELIINYAEVFGWEADDFTYEGGKRRNSRKRRNRQKNKTKNKTRKRQKNKTRKTIHKRKNRT
jgi:surface protein